MRKVLLVLLSITLLFGTNSGVAFAETEIKGLEENLDELLMRNYFTQEELAEMEKEYMEFYSEFALNTIIPGRQEMGKMQTNNVEEEYVLIMEQEKATFNDGLRVSNFLNYSYGDQYAKGGCFKYLFSEKEYWSVPIIRTGNGNSRTKYKINGKKIEYEDLKNYLGFENSQLYAQHKVLILVNKRDIIKNLFLKKGEKIIEEIKFCAFTGSRTGLYIKCPKQEYFLKVYDPSWTSLEVNDENYYELMTVGEMTQAYEQIWHDRSESYVTPVKPTFETEALQLQEEGLLKGNEKGLDLLKPLTRIEAATMILRALGESTISKATEQTFTDVPMSHWGYGAAENAYLLGLIKGIGNALFAPDEPVTGPEFATMVLRAGKHTEFNWEEALAILISEGVISSEDAAAMDFFTRGDMAKIIYESMEKGVL